jgi:hypothetical protein
MILNNYTSYDNQKPKANFRQHQFPDKNKFRGRFSRVNHFLTLEMSYTITGQRKTLLKAGLSGGFGIIPYF